MAIKSDDDEDHDLPYFSHYLSLSFSSAHTVNINIFTNVLADNEFTVHFAKATTNLEHTK